MSNTAENTKRIPSNAVLQRYGISRRTLSRWMDDKSLGFPKPLEINGRLYHAEAELDAFDRECAKRAGQRLVA